MAKTKTTTPTHPAARRASEKSREKAGTATPPPTPTSAPKTSPKVAGKAGKGLGAQVVPHPSSPASISAGSEAPLAAPTLKPHVAGARAAELPPKATGTLLSVMDFDAMMEAEVPTLVEEYQTLVAEIKERNTRLETLKAILPTILIDNGAQAVDVLGNKLAVYRGQTPPRISEQRLLAHGVDAAIIADCREVSEYNYIRVFGPKDKEE